MNLAHKTALITGASRGIGRAIALGLAEEGADVVVNYRLREKEAFEVASLIEAKGRKVLVSQADVSRYDEVKDMVQTATGKLGPIEILVNNAAVHKGGKVNKLQLDDWDAVLKSCLYGAFYCCKCVVASMLESKWGRIVNVSSTVGERGYPGDCAYGAAKAGLLGFTKSLAKELGPYGITVNAVMPGFVLTDMTKALTPENIQNIKKKITLGRICAAEDVAEMVSFLVSKGNYITGSVHHVDGGLVI
jgi:3-oxoacyl-[acyl-carrier protein] reductase